MPYNRPRMSDQNRAVVLVPDFDSVDLLVRPASVSSQSLRRARLPGYARRWYHAMRGPKYFRRQITEEDGVACHIATSVSRVPMLPTLGEHGDSKCAQCVVCSWSCLLFGKEPPAKRETAMWRILATDVNRFVVLFKRDSKNHHARSADTLRPKLLRAGFFSHYIEYDGIPALYASRSLLESIAAVRLVHCPIVSHTLTATIFAGTLSSTDLGERYIIRLSERKKLRKQFSEEY